jgi:hypothetical protein
MAEGLFSENGNPNFFSSTGEEWSIIGEVFTACHLFLTHRSPFSILHPSFSEKAIKGCHCVTPFSTEKLSYWLLFVLILHSPRTHSPTSEIGFSKNRFLHGEAIL